MSGAAPRSPHGPPVSHNPAMVPRALRWGYRKLGARYPRLVIAGQLQLSVIVLVGGLGLLRLYVTYTWTDFWRMLVVAALLLFAENVFALRVVYALLRPVDEWLRGRRDPDS